MGVIQDAFPGESGTHGSWMARAVELGRRGWGRVHPNPMVGCVLVRDGIVVGEGWHGEWGGHHAEVEALRQAGEAAAKAVAYVSLEPCRHHGKTPPCTQALIEAGVARVVYGARDPGEVSGGGAEELRAAGLQVTGPLLSRSNARRENPAFFHDVPDRPWTVLKLALSLDGGIAPEDGRRAQLTGPAAVEEVHRLRAGVEGIVVGTGTMEVDDPLLTVRGPVAPRVPPVRIVVDLGGRLTPGIRVLHEGEAPVWLLAGPGASRTWRKAMEAEGARVLTVEGFGGGGSSRPAAGSAAASPDGGEPWRPSPADLLRRLREEGLGSLLCEGGGRFGSALLRSGAVDRLIHVVAPLVLGSGAVPGYPQGVQSFEGSPRGAKGEAAEGGAERRAPEPVLSGTAWVPGPVKRLGNDLWMEWDRGHGPEEGGPSRAEEGELAEGARGSRQDDPHREER